MKKPNNNKANRTYKKSAGMYVCVRQRRGRDWEKRDGCHHAGVPQIRLRMGWRPVDFGIKMAAQNLLTLESRWQTLSPELEKWQCTLMLGCRGSQVRLAAEVVCVELVNRKEEKKGTKFTRSRFAAERHNTAQSVIQRLFSSGCRLCLYRLCYCVCAYTAGANTRNPNYCYNFIKQELVVNFTFSSSVTGLDKNTERCDTWHN